MRSLLGSQWLREQAILWGTIVIVQTALVGWYLTTFEVGVESVRYIVYPFIWINVGLWAVLNARPVTATRRMQAIAVGVSTLYFIVLLVLPEKIGLAGDSPFTSGFEIRSAVPGWGPAFSYSGSLVRAHLIPFEVIGYGALSYLVYVNVVRISRASLAGVLGIATCVGCTVPVLVPLLGILGGTGTTLASTAYTWSYDIGTVVYVVVVALLYYSHRQTA